MAPLAPASAQQGAVERSAAPSPTGRDQATRQPAKTINAQRAGSPARTSDQNGDQDAWSISNALPKDSKAIPAELPTASKQDFGRLQLETGSIGFSGQSQFKEGQFADGRRVPGLETVKRDQPTYFGLSLSVPTSGNTLIPMPILPRRE